MDESQVGRKPFGIAGGNAPPFLHAKERIFDQVAQFVEIFVVMARHFAAGSGRNDGFHPGVLDALHDGVRIVPPVGEEGVGFQPFDEGQSLRAISDCTRSDSDSDRKTK